MPLDLSAGKSFIRVQMFFVCVITISIRIQTIFVRLQTMPDGGSLGKSGNDYERRPGLRLPTRKPKAKYVNVSFLVVSTEDFRRP
jgi:hypothetical protein